MNYNLQHLTNRELDSLLEAITEEVDRRHKKEQEFSHIADVLDNFLDLYGGIDIVDRRTGEIVGQFNRGTYYDYENCRIWTDVERNW